MIRDVAAKLLGASLLVVLEKKGDPVGLAERDFVRHRTPHDPRARVELMVGLVLEHVGRALRARDEEGHSMVELALRDPEVEPAAVQLLQLLTSPADAGPYEWLMALAAFRLAAAEHGDDPVLDWFENDNFNVVVVESLRRLLAATR